MRSPYNYSFDYDTGTYQFITKNDIFYRVAFLEDNTLTTVSTSGIEFNNVYQVVIEKVSEQLEPLDSQVFLTIDTIINDFFSNIENALIYVCSDDMGKDKVRYQVFERWYHYSEHKDIITKVDNIIPLDADNVIYTSLLYHNDNPNVNYILKTFDEIEDALNKED